jgi:hypothetical protein
VIGQLALGLVGHPILALLLVLTVLYLLHVAGCAGCRERLRGGAKHRRRMDRVGGRTRGGGR